jgi:hypothetical protein
VPAFAGRGLAVAAVVVLLCGTAAATELRTGPLRNVGDIISCAAFNVGTTSVPVTAELIKDDGTVLQTATFAIQPGRLSDVAMTADFVSGAHCKFTFPGSKKKVRCYGVIYEGAGPGSTRVVLEAR